MSDFSQLQNYFQIGSGIDTHIDYDCEYATKDEIDTLVYVAIGERNKRAGRKEKRSRGKRKIKKNKTSPGKKGVRA